MSGTHVCRKLTLHGLLLPNECRAFFRCAFASRVVTSEDFPSKVEVACTPVFLTSAMGPLPFVLTLPASEPDDSLKLEIAKP